MISVLIPSQNSERELVPTLSALVPGSAEGLLREVILADGGSTDGTARIADAAGCDFRTLEGGRDARLSAAARNSRGTWLLLLDPASVLEEGWTREVAKFVETAERAGPGGRRAAAFRYAIDGYGLAPRLKEIAVASRVALTGRPRPEQGLLIARDLYLCGGGAGRAVILRTRLILPA